jgi:hypothetical protein
VPTHVPTDPTPADTSGRGRQVVDAATLRRRLQEAAAPRLLDVRTPTRGR